MQRFRTFSAYCADPSCTLRYRARRASQLRRHAPSVGSRTSTNLSTALVHSREGAWTGLDPTVAVDGVAAADEAAGVGGAVAVDGTAAAGGATLPTAVLLEDPADCPVAPA
eukprot:7382687-Prymnesium_polylepis.2